MPIVLLLTLCLTAQPKETLGLAVMPVQSRTLAAQKAAVLDNIIVSAVAELSHLKVISSNDVNAMLGLDRMKQALGCNDLSCAAEIGGALGVDYLLIVTADILGKDLVLTSSLLDIKNASAVARKRSRAPSQEETWLDAVEALLMDTFAKAPTKVDALAKTTSGPKGSIKVTSTHTGRVWLDGVDVGLDTPTVINNVSAGTHQLEVKSDAWWGSASSVVENNTQADCLVQMDVARSGSLRIDASEPNARVILDGQEVGTTPYLNESVAGGFHRVEILHPNSRAWNQEVAVVPDQLSRVNAKLGELGYAAAVVTGIRTAGWAPDDEGGRCYRGCPRSGLSYQVGLELIYPLREYLTLSARVGPDLRLDYSSPDPQVLDSYTLGGFVAPGASYLLPLSSNRTWNLELRAETELLWNTAAEEELAVLLVPSLGIRHRYASLRAVFAYPLVPLASDEFVDNQLIRYHQSVELGLVLSVHWSI